VTGPLVLDCDAVRDLAGLYAVGALEPHEAEAVRAHAAGCAVGHPELDAAASAATALLEAVEPVEPPSALRDRLLAAAAADLRSGRHPATAAAPGPAAPGPAAPGPATTVAAEPPVALEAARDRRRFRWVALAAAAALVLAAGLAGWNVALRGQLADAEAYRAGVEAALALASQPGSSSALLASEDGSVSGLGVVGGDGRVLLAFRGLAPTDGGQVYAAWAIGGDGVPVNIGEFSVGEEGTATASASAPGAAPGAVLAITLEPSPGATTPTMPIVASGTTQPVGG
jgi:hypothetical protein